MDDKSVQQLWGIVTRVERLIPRGRILVIASRGHQAEAQAQQVTARPFGANQDVQGFTTQALTHLDCVYNLAVWISGDTGEAEDLLQETYRQAVRSFHGLQPATNYRVWLLSILRHIYINRYQQKGQGSEGVEWEKINRAYKSMIEQGGSTADLFSQLTDHEIATVLKELPEEYRTAIVLVDIEKLSYEEASEVMACSLEVIRSRLSRGRRMLQGALQNSVRERDLKKGSPALNSWVTFRTRIVDATLSFLNRATRHSYTQNGEG